MPPGWVPDKAHYLTDNHNCMCGTSSDGGCTSNSGEMRMSTVIDIQPSDYIVGGWDVSELYRYSSLSLSLPPPLPPLPPSR